MTPVEFLIAAAHIGAGGRPRPLPALDATVWWETVVELAIEHGVTPLVGEALSGQPDVPVDVRSALEAAQLRNTATAIQRERTLADLVEVLRAGGVEVIVLERRPELHLHHGLDLLCRVSDYSALQVALLNRGYTSEGSSARAFQDPTGQVKVEVHFDALQFGLLDRSQEQFWRWARTRQVRGVDIWVLAPEHQFLQMAAHAHRHCYRRLSWLIELDLAIRSEGETMNWGLVTNLARAEGIGAVLRHAIFTVHQVLGTPLPRLPAATLEERCVGVCYRALWPFERTRALNQPERQQVLRFLPDDADLRNVLLGLVLVGRRREKLEAIVRRRWPAAS